MAPPRGGAAGRGKLKFQPKSSLRRSKEDRDADERKEQAVIQAEEAAADRERERERKRAERQAGRGRGGARGGRGGAQGGVSGWMSGGAGGLLSGSMGSSGSNAVRAPAMMGGFGGVSGIIGGGGGSSSGGASGGGNRAVKAEAGAGADGRGGTDQEDRFIRANGTRMRAINIEEINLVSDDESGEGGEEGKGKVRKERTPQSGLLPIRVARHEHVPRRMKINIDLDTLSEDDRNAAKEVAAAAPAERGADADVPIKIEDEEASTKPAKAGPAAKEKPKRGRGNEKKGADAAESDPGTDGVQDIDEGSPPVKLDVERQGRPISDLNPPQAAERPFFVRPDCNFIPIQPPSGWESREDVENWERNIGKMYAVYEELSFPEKMKLDGGAGQGDVDMTDDAAVGNTENKQDVTDKAQDSDNQQTKPDRKQDLVYIFQLAPGIPGLSSAKPQEPALEKKSGNDEEDVRIISSPSSPRTSRAKSPESTRKRREAPKKSSEATAAATSASSSSSKVKQEPGVEVKTEHGAPPLPSASTTAPPPIPSSADTPVEREAKSQHTVPLPPTGADESSGYVGDLVVYNTGEATIDWGGIPLHLNMGIQSNMLQHVLLTGAPVTREAARKKEADDAKTKAAVKKEPGTSGGTAAAAGPGAGGEPIDLDADNAGEAGASTSGTAAKKDRDKGKDKDKEKEKGKDKAFAMGAVAGSFTVVPAFRTVFGDKW